MTVIERLERRSKARVFLDQGFTIRFRVAGHSFEQVRITNLSEDGCFATFPQREAFRFDQGTILESLVLEHPELPHGPMTGRTSYVLDQMAELEGMELIGMGIHFLAAAPETTEALQRYVTRQLSAPGGA